MDTLEHSLFFLSHIDNKTAFFSEEERHHALSVLRKNSDQAILATDGSGSFYKCQLKEGGLEALVTETIKQPLTNPRVHVFIGIPERDPFEEAVTNLAAMGIRSVTPVVCQYCQQKWWASWEKHKERCRKKMIAGIKQARSAWLPELRDPMDFGESLEMAKSYNSQPCLVADGSGSRLAFEHSEVSLGEDVACFIGPPGGFSEKEIDAFKLRGFAFVKIANTRLRTELAAVVLCSQLMLKSIVA